MEAMLHQAVPRSRRAGADFTPRQAASTRVVVVSGAGKGGAGLRQVRIKKTNTREPLRTCRKTSRDVETGIETLSREAGGGGPVYGSTGVRHEGGVILIQAWMRNVGTCRPDERETRKRVALASARVPRRGTGTDGLVVVGKPGNAGGAKEPDAPAQGAGQPAMGGASA